MTRVCVASGEDQRTNNSRRKSTCAGMGSRASVQHAGRVELGPK